MPAFFPMETLVKRAFLYRQKLIIIFSLISSVIAKHFAFIDVLSFGKRKKSTGAKSGEYGGWLRHDYGFVFWPKTHEQA